MSNVAITQLKVSTKAQGTQPNGEVAGDGAAPTNINIVSKRDIVFATGTAAGQCDREVYMKIAIVLSGTQVLDLLAGTYTDGTNTGNLVDKNGAQVTLSKLRLVELRLLDEASGPTAAHLNAAGTNAVGYLGGQLHAHGNGSDDQPGEFLWTDALGVTVDSTHKTLNVVNESAIAGHIIVHLAGAH